MAKHRNNFASNNYRLQIQKFYCSAVEIAQQAALAIMFKQKPRYLVVNLLVHDPHILAPAVCRVLISIWLFLFSYLQPNKRIFVGCFFFNLCGETLGTAATTGLL
jgi:hypothetical protein